MHFKDAFVYAAWKSRKRLGVDQRNFTGSIISLHMLLYVIPLGSTGKPHRVSTQAVKLDSNLVKYGCPKTLLLIRAPHWSVTPLPMLAYSLYKPNQCFSIKL